MEPINNWNIPMVVEQTANGERAFDIYSRLLKERIKQKIPMPSSVLRTPSTTCFFRLLRPKLLAKDCPS